MKRVSISGVGIAGVFLVGSLAFFTLLQISMVRAQEPVIHGSIEGVVIRTDNGEAIADARLMVVKVAINARGVLSRVPLNAGRGRGLSAGSDLMPITDRNGRFAFKNLESGTFRIIALANEFVRQEYGQRSAGVGSGTLIDLAAGQTVTSIVIRMTRTGTVRGRVLDSAGQPAIGVPVQVAKYGYDATGVRMLRQLGTGSTDDRGEYRIFGITPGQYFVSAGNGPGPLPTVRRGSAPRAVYAQRYFPGVADIRDAEIVDVKSGDEAVADIKVMPVQLRTIRGSILDSSGNLIFNQKNPLGMQITLSFAFDTTNNLDSCGCIEIGRSFDPATGKFEIQNVIPGKYSIRASVPDPSQWAGAQPRNVVDTSRVINSRDELVVVGDTDVNDLVLTFSNPFSVQGKLTVEGQDSAQTFPQGLRFQYQKIIQGVPDDVGLARQLPISAGGTFRVERIHAAEYIGTVIGIPANFYLKSLRYDDKDLLENPLKISGAGTQGFEVVLSSKGGRVLGVVTDSDQRPVVGVPVVIVPDLARTRSDLYRNSISGADGKFAIEGVAPGDYRVFALDGMEPNRYFDSNFMKTYEAKGKSIHIAENESLTTNVQLIPVSTNR